MVTLRHLIIIAAALDMKVSELVTLIETRHGVSALIDQHQRHQQCLVVDHNQMTSYR